MSHKRSRLRRIAIDTILRETEKYQNFVDIVKTSGRRFFYNKLKVEHLSNHMYSYNLKTNKATNITNFTNFDF